MQEKIIKNNKYKCSEMLKIKMKILMKSKENN